MITKTRQLECRRGRRAYYLFFHGSVDDQLPSPLKVVDETLFTGKQLIVLDFTSAESVDPRALEWMEQLTALSATQAVRVRVVAPLRSKVRRTLDLVRFDQFMIVAGTLREALSINRNSLAA